jgi:hypothetical protein
MNAPHEISHINFPEGNVVAKTRAPPLEATVLKKSGSTTTERHAAKVP